MIRTALILLPVLALGACANQIGYHDGDLTALNEQHGQAVRQNILAQTVNPGGSSEPVVTSGARAAKAVTDYQNDAVEHPATSGTMSMKANAGTEGN